MPRLDRTLKKLIAEVEELEARKARELEDIRTEKQGLQLALRRYDNNGDGHELTETAEQLSADEQGWHVSAAEAANNDTSARDELLTATMTEAVAKILGQAHVTLSVAEVRQQLIDAGRDLPTTDPVRGALAYLKRKGQSGFQRRGEWFLVGGNADPTTAAPNGGFFRDATVPTNAEPPAATGGSVALTPQDLEGRDYHG